MNEVSNLPAEGGFDLGQWLGRRQAFSLVAGRCSAADADCIRRIRNEKLYRSRASDWEEFCESELHMSRSNADRLIRLLDKFGPEYFHISQITRIPAEQYRAIAPSVANGRLTLDGEVIPLTTENSERIAAAVSTLRRAARAEAGRAAPSAQERLSALQADCRRLLQGFREVHEAFGSPNPYLTGAVQSLAEQVTRLVMELDG
jgi:hypothetical protein